MAPRNRIELDERIKAKADELIRGGATVNEVLEALNGLGHDVSHSGVGRYFKKVKPVMAEYAEAQEVRKVWVDQFGKDPDGDIGTLLTNMLQMAAYGQLKMMGDQPADLSGEDGYSPKHVALLAGALKDMASAQKLTAERIMKVREEVKRQAADKVAEVAAAGGMKADGVRKLRNAVLGLDDGQSGS